MPQIFWQRSRPPMAEALVLAMLLLVAEVTLHSSLGWLLLVRLLWAGGLIYLHMTDLSLVLAGGVLSVARAGGVVQSIPLAVAQVERDGETWLVTWPEGRQERRRRLRIPAEFAGALQRTAASARAADVDAVPRTRLEARQAALISGVAVQDRRFMVVFALFVVAAIIGVLLETPITFVPFLMVFVLFGYTVNHGIVLLEGGRLWRLHPKEAARMVAVSAVTTVSGEFAAALIRTDDPALPEVRLNARYAEDLIRHLKRYLAVRQGGGSVGEEGAARTVRCALCGRPEAVTSAKERSVLICERCTGKVRYEAAEGGHGLLGKEPRPL